MALSQLRARSTEESEEEAIEDESPSYTTGKIAEEKSR